MLPNPEDLNDLILSTPRVLLQSVETSLAPKLQMITEAVDNERKMKGKCLKDVHLAGDAHLAAASILTTNPALLVTTNSILQSRLKRYQEHPSLSLAEALRPSKLGRKRKYNIANERRALTQRSCLPRRQRSVIEMSSDGTIVLNIFSNVQDAAKELNISASSVYAACGKNRQLRGRTLKYSSDQHIDIDKVQDNKVRGSKHSVSKNKWTEKFDIARLRLYDKRIEDSKVSIIAFVSGGMYPSDNIDNARGRRRAGGLALYFPQVKLGGSNLTDKFKLSTKQSFGMIMPEEKEGGSNFHEGLILVGFPFLRPSRNRCDLYACHGAIKVVLQLLKQAAAEKDMENIDVEIEICSDSGYACNLLRDHNAVLRWGSAPTLEDFRFDGNYPQHLANRDLLYPLAKTMYRIVNSDIADKRGAKLCLGRNITIAFRHNDDKMTYGYMTNLNTCARKTAHWQFDKS